MATHVHDAGQAGVGAIPVVACALPTKRTGLRAPERATTTTARIRISDLGIGLILRLGPSR